MMNVNVEAPDDEQVLSDLIRARLAGTEWAKAFVSNRLTYLPDGTEQPPKQRFAVIVRSDGGPSDPPLFVRRVGVRVFGPDGDVGHAQTGRLARRIESVLRQAWQHSSAVADTRATNGPYRVPETVHGRPESYLTAELVFVGTIPTS